MKHFRGINSELISAFKESVLYNLIKENQTDILVCVRNNAIGLYYNADRVAKIKLGSNGNLKCEINSYYLSDYYKVGGKRIAGKNEIHTPEYIYNNFEKIKKNSVLRCTPEKKAQQALIFANNNNPESKWICVDIEYRQSKHIQEELTNKFLGRFDIIAISKSEPHQIAIIELKFNKEAVGGKSGVVKHLKDFIKFNNSICIDNLKIDIMMQITNLTELGLLKDAPKINNVNTDFTKDVKFYVICLYDTEESPRGTVGGYLFNEIHPEWGTKKVSTKNAEKEITFGSNIISNVNFLFKQVASCSDIKIKDILDKNNYEK